MSRYKERQFFSELALDIGEKAQELPGRLGRSFTQAVLGSDAPTYQQLKWAKQPDIDTTDMAWCEIKGDKKANAIPRLRKRAAIIGTPWEELADMREQIGLGTEALEAPAYLSGRSETLRVGINPNGDEELFRNIYADGERYASVAMRLGQGPLRAAMGLWLPESQTFEASRTIKVVEESIAIDELADSYCLLPLV